MKLPLVNQNNVTSSNLDIALNFNYIEQTYTIKYVGVLDIVSRIGGYMASFLPLINILGPFLLLRFLKELADVMRILSVQEFFALSKNYFEVAREELIELVQTEKLDKCIIEMIGKRIQELNQLIEMENPRQRNYTKEEYSDALQQDDVFVFKRCAFKTNKLVEMLLNKELIKEHILSDK